MWETPYGPEEVAIKVLKTGTSEEDKVKFLQEAAIMAQFRHPHIVRLLGAVTVDEPVGVCGSVLVHKQGVPPINALATFPIACLSDHAYHGAVALWRPASMALGMQKRT